VPIRVHALAKQLNMDSRVLVSTCAAAGVTAKGPLASLSDEEVAKVMAYLEANKGAKTARPSARSSTLAGKPQPIRREDYIPPSATVAGKVPVLPPKPGERPAVARRREEPAPAVGQSTASASAAVPAASTETAGVPEAVAAVGVLPATSPPAPIADSQAESPVLAELVEPVQPTGAIELPSAEPALPPPAPQQELAADWRRNRPGSRGVFSGGSAGRAARSTICASACCGRRLSSRAFRNFDRGVLTAVAFRCRGGGGLRR
jgi:translation initiation factor IF-2